MNTTAKNTLDAEHKAIVKRARVRFAEFKKYLDLQAGTEVRDLLFAAKAEFGELDSRGIRSDKEMKDKFEKLMKEAHLVAARQALDYVLRFRDPKQIDVLFLHLGKANSNITALAAERKESEEVLMAEIALVLGGAATKPDVRRCGTPKKVPIVQ
jgi:hypothetical protein